MSRDRALCSWCSRNAYVGPRVSIREIYMQFIYLSIYSLTVSIAIKGKQGRKKYMRKVFKQEEIVKLEIYATGDCNQDK